MFFKNSEQTGETEPTEQLVEQLQRHREVWAERSDQAVKNEASELHAYFSGKSDAFEEAVMIVEDYQDRQSAKGGKSDT